MQFSKIYKESDIKDLSLEMIDIFESKLQNKNLLIIGLTGDLGAGKTTMVKQILKDLGVTENVISPTFVLRKDYDLKSQKFDKVIHIDAYRLDKKEYIAQILDLKDFLDIGNRILIIVEWAKLADLAYDIHFEIQHLEDKERQINVIM